MQSSHFPPYNTPKKAWRKSLRHAPIKENLIVKIEISYSNSFSGTKLFLVLRILRIKVGPTAHPVVAAIKGTDVGYCVETCPAGETCGTKQWASCDRSIAICTNGIHTSEIYILKLELAILGILHDGKVVNLRTWDDVEGECPGISLRTRHCFSVHPHIVITLRQWCYGQKSVAFFGNLNLEKLALIR
mgnify:FL=1